jgi:hypothetical protein
MPYERRIDPITIAHEPLDVYLEGTDACGKDSVARLIESHRQTTKGEKYIRSIASAGFFSSEMDAQFATWREQYPEAGMSGVLLAATVFDLASNNGPQLDTTPRIQISHNAIRGTAYQQAFDMPLGDLFAAATAILPRNYWPVALTASIPELQQRVKNNPHSTPFDFLVCEQPDKIEAMISVIREKCTALGGMAINTTSMTPGEIAEHVDTEAAMVLPPELHDAAFVQETANVILDELRSRDRAHAQIVDSIQESLYERQV